MIHTEMIKVRGRDMAAMYIEKQLTHPQMVGRLVAMKGPGFEWKHRDFHKIRGN